MIDIEQYKQANGYYDTRKMRQEIAGMDHSQSLMDDFFGTTDEGTKTTDIYPEIEEAERRNAALQASEEAEEAEIVRPAYGRCQTGTASNADWVLVAEAGLAVSEATDEVDLFENPAERLRLLPWRKPRVLSVETCIQYGIERSYP